MRGVGRHCQSALVVLVGVLATADRAEGQTGTTGGVVGTAARVEAAVRVDGDLDDEAWTAAERLERFTQVDPDYGVASRAATEVRVIWNDEALYVGARMTDPEGRGSGRVEGLRRDFAYQNSDVFGVVLDGFGDGRFAMAFLTTPHGAQRDLLVFDGRDIDEAWNGVWQVRTVRTESGWTAELEIPWSTLRYLGTGSWKANFIRESRAIQETSAWSPWQRGVQPWDMTYAGRLDGLRPPPPALNAQVQPYAVTRSEATGTGLFDDPDQDGDLGLDVKWAIAPNTVLDVTYNMDFAQAEVDRQVVNLDRFSVLFPERRTFFLESGGLFDTGLDVVSPFYSRRIGLDAGGAPVPVTAGGRLTHRSRTSSAGALVARQGAHGAADGSVFGVGRFVRNVGETGRLGALVTTRHDEGLAEGASALNTVVAVDGFGRPTRTLSVRGMVSRSFTEGSGGDGWAAHAWVGNSAPWGYLGWLQEYVGADWEPRSGFVFDRDLVTTSPALSFDLRPGWLPGWIRAYRPGVTTYFFNRASTGDFFAGTVSFRPLVLGLENGGNVSFGVLPEWQRFDQAFDPVQGVSIDEGRYAFTRWQISAAHDPSADVTGSVSFEWGPFYDGRLETSVVNAKVALAPQVIGFASWEHNRFRGFGAATRTTHLVRPELRLAASPRLEVAGIWQYNTAVHASSLNLRLSWEFRPLSFFYVVYNDIASLDRALDPFPARRQLILKATWLWQP